ncbi:MAG: hypothetical protein ACYSU0_11225 [Planctomycetota bacterium]
MVVRGKVKGGVVVLDKSGSLPEGTVVRVEPVEDKAAAVKAPEGEQSLAEMLLSLAGTVKGLPEDMALNHDHYLYGLPKKKK